MNMRNFILRSVRRAHLEGTASGGVDAARFIVFVVVAIGWLIAAVFAYAFISLFGFFGLGFYGLLLLFICTQVDLDAGGNAARSTAQPWVTQNMSPRERALWNLRQSLTTIGFYKAAGIALTAIGFGGFLYFQLD
jgi:hypothetical protein